MHRSYAIVVEPVIEALRPRSIAEIGAGRGRLTARLLRTPGAAAAQIHAIDPDLTFTPAQLDDHAGQVSVHHDRALPALTRIGAVDLLLVDGDPNWHAVTSTLELAARIARHEGRPLPVALVHNVHWPFGRRDGYYDPEALPEHARRPHVADGLAKTTAAPVADGLRLTPHVAIDEYGDRNGVLTAVEDFVRADDEPWEIVDMPGFGGTAGLIASARLESEPALRGLLATLRAPVSLRRAARRAEAGRIEAELRALRGQPTSEDLITAVAPSEAGRVEERAEQAQLQAALDGALTEAREAAAARDEVLARAERLAVEVEANTAQEALLDDLRARLRQLDGEVRELLEHRARHEAALWRIETLERDLAARESERRETNAERDLHAEAAARSLAALEQARTELTGEREGLEAVREQLRRSETVTTEQAERIEELAETERLLSGRVLHLEDMLQAARAEIADEQGARAQTDAALRDAHIDAAEIAIAVRAVRGTRRSRVAHGVRRALRRATFRPDAPSALERALSLTERYPELPVAHQPDVSGVGELTQLPR